jgi:HlyD family secretion protein
MKKWLALAVLICFISAFLSGCAKAQTTPQETATVTRGNLLISVSVSGNLEMPHKMDLSFGTTGMVEEILVEEGDSVVKGQMLARLDAGSLESVVETRRIDYKIAEYKLMQTVYPHYLSTIETDLPGAWLALEEAQSSLEEAQRLLEEGKVEEARVLLGMVEASLDKAQRKSQSRPWALPLSVKLMELEVDCAKIALDMAEADLAEAMITAPFDGLVTDININEGQQLSTMTYANAAICLVDPSEIEMSGVIDEIDIAKVKLGQEAIISLDALPDKEVKGKLTFISQIGTVQAGVVSYKATITLENPDEELRDGMSATAEIVIDRRDNVLLIPNRAIQGTWDSPWAEVVTGEQTEQRQVTLGSSDGVNTEVLSGLEEGEMVVLPAASQLPFMSFGG